MAAGDGSSLNTGDCRARNGEWQRAVPDFACANCSGELITPHPLARMSSDERLLCLFMFRTSLAGRFAWPLT